MKQLCIFLLFISSSTLAQSDYGDYAEARRTHVFFDNFDNNQNEWITGTLSKGNRVGKIENGYYYWDANSKYYGLNATWKAISIDENKDFEIEAAIKFVKGNPREEATALSWGRSGKGSFYLAFKKDEYVVSIWTDRRRPELVTPWTQTSLLKKGDYNKLTIRKVGSTYYLFINEGLVYTMPKTKKFFGPNIGFESNNVIHVDYLRVSYLKGADTAPAVSPVAQRPTTSEALPTVAAYDSIAEPSSAASSVMESPALPTITILEPELSRGFKKAPSQMLRVSGRADSPEGVQTVLVNEQAARLESDGLFSTEVPLKTGNNIVTVQVKDNNNQVATKTFSVQRNTETDAATARRLALVIGNAHYTNGGSLENPINDVRAMETTLKNLGFTVLKYEDCSQSTIKRAIDAFGQQLVDYDVGLFFYAGHGIQVGGNNYLIPVDAQLTSENDVEYDCVRADRVLAKMESAGSKTNIAVLDACRDNPFERSWSRGTQGNGLAFMNAPQGSLIAYATAPGQTASDGKGGKNGLYTAALLENITLPGLTIEQVFKRVRANVTQRSEGKQTPWESTSLTGDFYFKP